MDPVTLGVVGGAATLSSLAQLYQSEQARKASQARLDEIKQAFDAIKPPDFNVTPSDPPDLIRTQVPDASFDFSKMTPEQYSLVGKYSPQGAALVKEQNPTLVQETATGQQGRAAQINALQKLRQVADQEQNPELQQQLQDANKQAQIAAQSRSQSVLQDAARRGELGSGASLAAQLQGSSDAMSQGAQQSSNAASAAYQARLSALAQAGQLGGQVENSDVQNQARNAGIINDFNARTAASAQQFGNNQANMQNQAQLQNLQTAQQTANANVQQNNQQANVDRSRQDQLLQYLTSKRQNDINNQNQLAMTTAQWNRDNQNTQNQLAQQSYTDLFNKTSAANNVGLIQNQQANQFAADKNQGIQGLGNAAMSIGMYNDSQNQAKARTQYAKTGQWDDGTSGGTSGGATDSEEDDGGY